MRRPSLAPDHEMQVDGDAHPHQAGYAYAGGGLCERWAKAHTVEVSTRIEFPRSSVHWLAALIP